MTVREMLVAGEGQWSEMTMTGLATDFTLVLCRLELLLGYNFERFE